MEGTHFESERLAFRELEPEDVGPRYVGWLRDPDINSMLETRFSEQSEETVRNYVASVKADPISHMFRIAMRADKRHIGNIKLGPINSHHQCASISLFIGERECHGKGYASEAIGRVSRWAFDTLGLIRIEGGCYAENLGSLQSFLRNGYTVEGFQRSARIDAAGQRTGVFLFARLAPGLG